MIKENKYEDISFAEFKTTELRDVAAKINLKLEDGAFCLSCIEFTEVLTMK